MTVLHDVEKLVARLSPDPICDDCIAKALNLAVRQHANHKTRELAGRHGFERSKLPCSMCGIEKISIRQVAR